MKFGNWKFTATSIEWENQQFQRFVIKKHQLLETEKVDNSVEDLYKQILLATNEDWLSDDDLYDLNFAFVYAAGAWELNLDYIVFDNTLGYQYKLLDDEEVEL